MYENEIYRKNSSNYRLVKQQRPSEQWDIKKKSIYFFYGASCVKGSEVLEVSEGTTGLVLRYSRTKTWKILLRFWIAERSRFCSSSWNVCQTEGKGEGIRWRTRTPDGEGRRDETPIEHMTSSSSCLFVWQWIPLRRNGRWSSSMMPTLRSGQKYCTLLGWSNRWFMEWRRFSEHRKGKNRYVFICSLSFKSWFQSL